MLASSSALVPGPPMDLLLRPKLKLKKRREGRQKGEEEEEEKAEKNEVAED